MDDSRGDEGSDRADRERADGRQPERRVEEVIVPPLTDSALAAYCWMQGKIQRDEPVTLELLMERFEWTNLDAMEVQAELLCNGLMTVHSNWKELGSDP